MPEPGAGFLQRALTLRHLRLLIALDELRQVRRVAEQLHVSQPAVSKALAEIEAGIGATLFERTPRGLVPTAQGACLVRHAQIVCGEVARAGEELAGIASGARTTVAVGVMHGATSGVLPAAIALARQREPGLVVRCSEGPIDALLQQLRSGQLDLVVGAQPDRAVPTGLTLRALYGEPLAVVCGVGHPLAQAQSSTAPDWPQLMTWPWVLLPRAARVRSLLDALWRRQGLATPEVVAETVSLDLLLELLPGTPWLALMAERTSRKYVAAGLLASLGVPVPGVVMPVGVLRLADAPPAAAVTLLEDCLAEVAVRS